MIQIINYNTSNRRNWIDDEEIVNLISSTAGSAVSTSLIYEQAIVNQYRINKLLNVKLYIYINF